MCKRHPKTHLKGVLHFRYNVTWNVVDLGGVVKSFSLPSHFFLERRLIKKTPDFS